MALSPYCRWHSPNCGGRTPDSLWEEPCVPRPQVVRVCGAHVADAILKDYRLLGREEADLAEVLLT